jgi:hypothetical protein
MVFCSSEASSGMFFDFDENLPLGEDPDTTAHRGDLPCVVIPVYSTTKVKNIYQMSLSCFSYH